MVDISAESSQEDGKCVPTPSPSIAGISQITIKKSLN